MSTWTLKQGYSKAATSWSCDIDILDLDLQSIPGSVSVIG
jgi:hypothetical protein